MARDSDDPRANGFPFPEALLPFDRAAEGLICAVFDVGMIDRLSDDARHDGAHERPWRGRIAPESVVFSMF